MPLFSRAISSVSSTLPPEKGTRSVASVLREKPSGDDNWDGPYLPKPVPPDAWGKPFQYKSPGDHGQYDLFSYGADGNEGGEGNDKDIVSWE